MIQKIKIIAIVFLFALSFALKSNAQTEIVESHNKVAMRMIGHQVLLSLGDNTSRVLPITKEGGKYKIQFATEFEFNPDDLIATIDRVVEEKQIANHYIVEIVNCDTKEIVHSYEVGKEEQSLLTCKGRAQPKACYSILFTILETSKPNVANSQMDYILVVFVLLIIVLIYYFRKQKTKQQPHLISIGAYTFDPRNMELLFKKERFELTSKESELLSLLYNSANSTVERDVILKNVWGDEGDYIGRTLDVFISKLRKKLEADTNIKIINIRGVGYKLVLNGEY